jgi:hypothetical protein
MQLHLIPSEEVKLPAKAVIRKLVPSIDVDPELKPSEFIQRYWSKYALYCSDNFNAPQNSLNGKVFEALISIALCRVGIVPHYAQAKVAYIPGVNYDCIVYTREIGPISISAKVSMRERWKQADLEALALKNIHRRSVSYLVSMDANEIRSRQKDTVSALAINRFVLASAAEFDEMLDEINQFTFIEAPTVVAVTSPAVITAENGKSFYF